MIRRVLLVDDHALVRAGMKALISGFPGFEVVGEASDGREALMQARALEPDIVVMDIAMPGLNGFDATARLRRSLPGCAILIVSMHTVERYVIEAFQAGASAYVIKDAAPEELELALVEVARGRRYLSSSLSPELRGDRIRPASMRAPPAAGGDGALTSRQREILQLIAEGRSTREIGERLCISIKTVETHRAQLMQRLGIFDVAGLTRHAIRVGLVSPDD
jgi:DNA-binding NarL/FixJ family response regulator